MRVSTLYSKAAKDLSIPEKRVRKIYQEYWRFCIDSIRELSLDENTDEDYFDGLRSGFFIQKVGRFYCDYKNFNKRNKHTKNAEDK